MEASAFITWYLAFILLGLIGLPIANSIFKEWPDRGYIFAKFIGLFVVSMPLWFLGSLHIVPFSEATVWASFLITLVIAVYFLRKQQFRFNRIMLVQELIFFTIFLVWVSIRSYNSQVEGTEKFMNLAFINSIFSTEYFPPADPWFSGGSINYYYLGHYMYAYLAKLLNIGTGIVYNFALVGIVAQLFASLLSIFLKIFSKLRIRYRYLLGIMAASWISFGGNMHYAFTWLQSVITGKEFSYFFPNPTRIIPFAIDEFPAYSIILGDLHGHYIVLPFLVISVALAYEAFKIQINTKAKIIFNATISSFVIALYGINSWDVITVVCFFSLIHLYQTVKLDNKHGIVQATLISLRQMKGVTQEFMDKVVVFIKAEAALLVPGLVFMLPYMFNFQPAVGGIGIVPLDRTSPVGPWILMWGMFVLITMFYLGFKLRGYLKKSENSSFVEVLLFLSLGLVFGVEILFFKDIFFESNFDYFRTNTVFKFYYHAWILWGIACSWFVYVFTIQYKKRYKSVMLTAMLLILVFFVAAMAYIFRATKDFYPFENPQIVSIDGTAYIKKHYPEDYELINWINENIEKQYVVVEEVGDAYTYSSRISTHTPLVTIMGWPTHQWQWRGEAALAFDRADAVRDIYTSKDFEYVTFLLNEYNVKYIVVANRERAKYEEINEDYFEENFDVVFEIGKTRLYQVD